MDLPGAADLLDFHARAYDPTSGRFISPDPLPGATRLPQARNRYAYGLNNPFRYPDAYGMCSFIVADCVAEGVQGAWDFTKSEVIDPIGDYAHDVIQDPAGTFSGLIRDTCGSVPAFAKYEAGCYYLSRKVSMAINSDLGKAALVVEGMGNAGRGITRWVDEVEATIKSGSKQARAQAGQLAHIAGRLKSNVFLQAGTRHLPVLGTGLSGVQNVRENGVARGLIRTGIEGAGSAAGAAGGLAACAALGAGTAGAGLVVCGTTSVGGGMIGNAAGRQVADLAGV